MLDFYGAGYLDLIVHGTVPLTILFRFHSSVCLAEIWKNAYKLRGPAASDFRCRKVRKPTANRTMLNVTLGNCGKFNARKTLFVFNFVNRQLFSLYFVNGPTFFVLFLRWTNFFIASTDQLFSFYFVNGPTFFVLFLQRTKSQSNDLEIGKMTTEIAENSMLNALFALIIYSVYHKFLCINKKSMTLWSLWRHGSDFS